MTQTPPDEHTSDERPSTSLRRARVLIIDDEKLLANAISRMLSSLHDPVVCGNAQSALDLLQRGFRFDVILCDLSMEDMTGMDFHAEVMKTDPCVASQIVFMTGGASSPRAQKFLDDVPNVRLEKPFSSPLLLALIAERVR